MTQAEIKVGDYIICSSAEESVKYMKALWSEGIETEFCFTHKDSPYSLLVKRTDAPKRTWRSDNDNINQ